MFNKVSILCVGYSKPDGDNVQCVRANCTSTLIQTKSGLNIIVDTMTPWDGEILKSSLALHSLQPENINYVICTHGHSDHTGCNYLFQNALWHFVGTCVSRHDCYYDWDPKNPYILKNTANHNNNDNNDDVIVMHTPGHTLSCISIIIRDTNLADVVGVCGDLFEREEDIWDKSIWLNAGSENPRKQMINRLKLIEMCNYIIPGHGNGFHVTNSMRHRLKEDYEGHNETVKDG